MLTDLVGTRERRQVEAASLMGELFIQKPNGETITIHQDGTEIREQQPLQIDWCDKCEKWQPLEGGEMTRYQGLDIVWLCKACK
jgi:hypothetical protein